MIFLLYPFFLSNFEGLLVIFIDQLESHPEVSSPPQDYVLHPYLSMQQMGDVKADNIKGFVIGSSNMLFKHQSHINWDVLVDVSSI